MKILYVLLITAVLLSCMKEKKVKDLFINKREDINTRIKITKGRSYYQSLFKQHPTYRSNGFDFPVGKPNAQGYYNAQGFGKNNHLGDDWNGTGGGNTDLGDSIYSIANGYVSQVKNYKKGWGNVVRIVHSHNDSIYESLYAHCDTIVTKAGLFVKKGDPIATIGNLNGYYLAHLHLEIRNDVHLAIGFGYAEDSSGYLNPTKFIKNNRQN
jgi:murein DD-endopeptidase MepM/ murein hydrolase activator NlpD